MTDASPSNQKLYKLFKVDKTDLTNYLESIKPVKREKSPHDPYYHKLKFRKYHAKVHTTEEIKAKFQPGESRRFTDDRVI